MALWLFRAGRTGEYESKFVEDKKIYLTWEGLSNDLSSIKDKKTLSNLLLKTYPDEKLATIRNWTGQIWPFVKEMKIGDWIVLPSRKKPAMHFAEIKSTYVNAPQNSDPFYHFREVKWFAIDIPRSNFEKDILYSLGCLKTICSISRNNAEKRVKEMAKNKWKLTKGEKNSDDEEETSDLEQLAKDEIAKYIIRKFKGHGMATLIEAILKAQGYTTYLSPAGPDKGIDILASPGPLGFGKPRICVQVKTGENPIDRPTLDQLIGAMQNVNADQGLLVSWTGFKTSIDKEIPIQFFRVRLWDQNAIIDELMSNYDKLDDYIKAELPLKRIWALALPEIE